MWHRNVQKRACQAVTLASLWCISRERLRDQALQFAKRSRQKDYTETFIIDERINFKRGTTTISTDSVRVPKVCEKKVCWVHADDTATTTLYEQRRATECLRGRRPVLHVGFTCGNKYTLDSQSVMLVLWWFFSNAYEEAMMSWNVALFRSSKEKKMYFELMLTWFVHFSNKCGMIFMFRHVRGG